MNEKAAQFLLTMECPVHYIGYMYLKEMIICAVAVLRENGLMPKTLYTDIAKKFNTSADNVERCVRTLIAGWWGRLRVKGLFDKRPTNRECVLQCAEYILTNSRQVAKSPRQSVYEVLLNSDVLLETY